MQSSPRAARWSQRTRRRPPMCRRTLHRPNQSPRLIRSRPNPIHCPSPNRSRRPNRVPSPRRPCPRRSRCQMYPTRAHWIPPAPPPPSRRPRRPRPGPGSSAGCSAAAPRPRPRCAGSSTMRCSRASRNSSSPPTWVSTRHSA